jgi:intraflagellar transport protein 80
MRRLSTSNASAKAKGGGEQVFVLTATDGCFYLMNRTGRVEKRVDAHKGAVLCARWSFDGSSLLTGTMLLCVILIATLAAGEDGSVKIWSRNGMLRTTLATSTCPVYAVAWAPDNNAVCTVSA